MACNDQQVILPSAIRTSLTTSVDQTNHDWRGVHVSVAVTLAPGVDTITPKIQGRDAQGNYYDILVGPAISASGTTVLKVYPGITAAANASASDFLPAFWRVSVAHSAASNFTYSVNANLEK